MELKDEAAEMWNSHDLIVKNRDLNHESMELGEDEPMTMEETNQQWGYRRLAF